MSTARRVVIRRDREKKVSMPVRTLWQQDTAERGILILYIAMSWWHSQKEIERTIDAASETFAVYRKALHEGVEKCLRGPVVKPVFRWCNHS